MSESKDKSYESKKKWQRENRDKHRKAVFNWKKKHPEENRKHQNQYNKKNKDKKKAHLISWKKKSLEKSCKKCGSTEKLERHHPDYSRPTEILTLCKKCHVEEHYGKTE